VSGCVASTGRLRPRRRAAACSACVVSGLPACGRPLERDALGAGPASKARVRGRSGLFGGRGGAAGARVRGGRGASCRGGCGGGACGGLQNLGEGSALLRGRGGGWQVHSMRWRPAWVGAGRPPSQAARRAGRRASAEGAWQPQARGGTSWGGAAPGRRSRAAEGDGLGRGGAPPAPFDWLPKATGQGGGRLGQRNRVAPARGGGTPLGTAGGAQAGLGVPRAGGARLGRAGRVHSKKGRGAVCRVAAGGAARVWDGGSRFGQSCGPGALSSLRVTRGRGRAAAPSAPPPPAAAPPRRWARARGAALTRPRAPAPARA
jgi:hypothetical protein